MLSGLLVGERKDQPRAGTVTAERDQPQRVSCDLPTLAALQRALVSEDLSKHGPVRAHRIDLHRCARAEPERRRRKTHADRACEPLANQRLRLSKRGPRQLMLKVKLLERVGRKGKGKIRFEDEPHPGLEEYISTRQVVCAWGQRQGVLRDEERQDRLDEFSAGVRDGALTEAAEAVLTSTAETGAYCGETGISMAENELQRILDRAGGTEAPTALHHLGYRDRHGDVHLPLDAVVAVAKAFAAAEPRTVVEYLDDLEEELRIKGRVPGDRWYHDYLREPSPGHAIARQRAGLEQEAEMLRQEIARLRILLSRAAHDLKDAGKERKANALLRALEGRWNIRLMPADGTPSEIARQPMPPSPAGSGVRRDADAASLRLDWLAREAYWSSLTTITPDGCSSSSMVRRAAPSTWIRVGGGSACDSE